MSSVRLLVEVWEHKVQPLPAVPAVVGHDVAGLGRVVVRPGGEQVSSTPTVHAGDDRLRSHTGPQPFYLVCHHLLRSHIKTLSDGRDIRDVTGGDDGSSERDESVEQLLELCVVEGAVGGEGERVGPILDVGPCRLA